MFKLKYYFNLFLIIAIVNVPINSFSDNHNFHEIIKLIQKDLRTLERAVYSENFSTNNDETKDNITNIDQNSE